MTLEERAHLRLMRDTLQPHDIRVAYIEGQWVLSIFDKLAGLIRWRAASDILAYKLGLDMRDHRSEYIRAKADIRAHAPGCPPCPMTHFFQSNIDRLEAA